MAAITICSDFGAQKNKVWYCFYCFPIYFPWSDGTRCHDSFPNVELLANFSLSFITFIKRLFSSSSLSAIRMVSSAYLRLLISPGNLDSCLYFQPSISHDVLCTHISYKALCFWEAASVFHAPETKPDTSYKRSVPCLCGWVGGEDGQKWING